MTKDVKRRILDGSLDLLRAEGGGAITLATAAKQVGLTKPGLMYHFPTKEALMLGVVDHVAARWEELLLDRLGQPLETASPHQRIRAYVEVALAAQFDRADFAIYADALYREALTAAWVRRFEGGSTCPTTCRRRPAAGSRPHGCSPTATGWPPQPTSSPPRHKTAHR